MKPVRPCAILFICMAFLFPMAVPAADLNDIAYENRIHLQAGTIWNTEYKGDCLLFPYFDVRKTSGKTQISQIQIENFGEYGIAAKLRFKDWARGKEIFSKDIWIASKGSWSGKVELSPDGTNAIITSQGNIIWRNDNNNFYFTNSLLGGAAFSVKNIRKGMGESTLYGFVEVIGEEKTSPDETGGKVGRLAKSERDCPNTLKGSLMITRVEDNTTMVYEAVAIGNFSRGQGSLFRSPGSPYPKLDNGEDSLDQLDFQLSKFEVFGPFSVNPSNGAKTSLIITYPTKTFHYPHGRRSADINNPFEALGEIKGEPLKTALSKDGQPLNAESEIVLPYAVNIIGLYPGSPAPPAGIDNLSMPVYNHQSGEVKVTSDNMAQRVLIQDYEYFKEMFTTYRGLPALGLLLREYRNPDILHTDLSPAEFSAVWESSLVESILFPNVISGPSSGVPTVQYPYTLSGASSTLGHPIQYFIDWGDGTTAESIESDWLDVGVTTTAHAWATAGTYAVRVKARCALHPNERSKWSKELIVRIEYVSPPTVLSGPVTGVPNVPYTYTTGGAVSSIGHPVQYQFDWGDGSTSPWLPVGATSASKIWESGRAEGYKVTVKARCAMDTLVESDPALSPVLTVKIETVTVPPFLSGPVVGLPNTSYTYTAGGSVSSLGHPVQYRFYWGDGTDSNWLPVGTTSATKAWTSGTLNGFDVAVKARCATDPLVESDFSQILKVFIETISEPNIPAGPTKGLPGEALTFMTGGAYSVTGDPIEYQFDWGDGTFSGWVTTPVATKSWAVGESYKVRARARCVLHPSIVSNWSNDLTVNIEKVEKPATPTGQILGIPFTAYTYRVSGIRSNVAGEPLEAIIYWGDGSDTGWIKADSSGTITAVKVWQAGGTYNVTARARCATHTFILSELSDPLEVKIESVSTPNAPQASGGAPDTQGVVYTFTVDGASSNVDHVIEYRFDWGDGTQSLWITPGAGGTASATHQWNATGTYSVTARARCKLHPDAISGISPPLVVNITITPP